jgi:MOSC domain-containing protein YiiM
MEIVSINIGKPISVEYKGSEIKTGIYKFQIQRPVYLSKLNFDGDGQADLIHHGGVEKAVCVYSYEHYPYFEKRLNSKLSHGAFGENLTVSGMLEKDICIGDVFRIGEAVLQVSQPRQPCFKLAKRYNLKELPLIFQETGYTGFYFRVLNEGWVSPDSVINLIIKDHNAVTVEFANQIMHYDKKNLDAINKILKVSALSRNWRSTFNKRLNGEEIDTKPRLHGNN